MKKPTWIGIISFVSAQSRRGKGTSIALAVHSFDSRLRSSNGKVKTSYALLFERNAITSRKTEIEKQQNIALVSDFSNATVDIPQTKSDIVYVPIPEDERGEDYIELDSSEAPLK